MAATIRANLGNATQIIKNEVDERVKVLYGSVKAANAITIMSVENVDAECLM